MDEANGRFGKFTAMPAAQGFTRGWSARSESRSPNYTTRLADVLGVAPDRGPICLIASR